MYYIWGTRMLTGDFIYEFAVFPFAGEWRQADLHLHELAYNFPVVCASGQPGAGRLGNTLQPLATGSDKSCSRRCTRRTAKSMPACSITRAKAEKPL